VKYDCFIIGGGLSGFTCGIKCLKEGLSCAIISSGMSALHFSSGSIDLMGYYPDRGVVYKPVDYLADFINKNSEHPYAKCGIDLVREAFAFIREELRVEDLDLYCNGDDNHFHVTAMGTLKPTYLSQRSVFNERIKEAFKKRTRIAILNFRGFRDFYPDLAIAILKKNSLFSLFEIVSDTIELPMFRKTGKNPHEFRSIDIARIFDSETYLQKIANKIKKAAGSAAFVGLPAFIGINNYNRIHKRLEELTGTLIYEVPTLPPSILGMRIDNALKSRFAALGGVYIGGDKVTGGEIRDAKIHQIHTSNYHDPGFSAEYYVLSSGSFFSGGLASEFNRIREPIFDLRVYGNEGRNRWYSSEFFSRASHPFLEFGVLTDRNFNPFSREGHSIENLFCTGAILSNYNPVREGSGGGVALSTGYYAAEKIIERIRKR
jgi:glycerol-3-phosphate dehydrogenase subunit B